MRALKIASKWISIIALLLLLLIAVVWAISRAVYPTKAQRQAIAELERWPEYGGENAFALLWTLDFAVPEDALARVMAEDVRRISTEVPDIFGEKLGTVVPTAKNLPSAAHAYPDLSPSSADRQLFCASFKQDCLERVRDDLDAYTALVERHASLLDRVDSLQGFGFIRSAFTYSIWTPRPDYSSTHLPRTRHAVQFANGRRWEAVAGTCRDMLTWRRLGARSDGLSPRMHGDAISSRENGWLLASMLAELPVDEPLPEPCEEALAPPTALELSLCNAMRGEFGLNATHIRNPGPATNASLLDRLIMPIFDDPEAGLGMRAEGFLALCKAAADDVEARQRRDALQRRYGNLWRLECVGNLMGCVLNAISVPPYSDYAERVTDHGARLRALGTLAWMRSQAGQGQSPAALLDSRPAELTHPGDELGFGPDGRTLRIKLRWARRDEYWSIPLPAPLHAKSPADSGIP